MKTYSLKHSMVVAAIASAGIMMTPVCATAQASLTNASPTYTQDFNTLPVPSGSATITDFPWTNDSTLPNWYMFQSAAGGVTRIYAGGHVSDNVGYTDTEGAHVDTGSGRPWSWGSPATSTERALGTIASSTKGRRAIGLRMKNNGLSAIESLAVSYTGEQWGNQQLAANTNTLTFSYTVSASPITTFPALNPIETGYTGVTALNFVSLQSSGAAEVASSVINGNDAANKTALSSTITVSVPVGSEILLRWYDANEAGADAGLAIDDLTVTATFAAGVNDWSIY